MNALLIKEGPTKAMIATLVSGRRSQATTRQALDISKQGQQGLGNTGCKVRSVSSHGSFPQTSIRPNQTREYLAFELGQLLTLDMTTDSLVSPLGSN